MASAFDRRCPPRTCRSPGFGDGVVVEEHDEPAARFTHTSVVPAGEAAIVGQGNEPDPRESVADERDGSIGGSVVDDDRFSVDALLRGDGVQARLEILPAVPGNNHDRRGGAWS